MKLVKCVPIIKSAQDFLRKYTNPLMGERERDEEIRTVNYE